MKNHFSTQSDHYAFYRPRYPKEFFSYLNSITAKKRNAWDCGTGNGQVAVELARFFDHVYASDISQSQLDQAFKGPNIKYSLQPAEKLTFPDHHFDLITVAQAIHWFNFEKFYAEVRRTAASGALLCVMGYGRIRISSSIDPSLDEFYESTVGRYWDEERHYIDEEYQSIPFPFIELPTPDFRMTFDWTTEHLAGYLSTWSAVKKYIKINGHDPVPDLQESIKTHWSKGEIKTVQFPFLLRIGQVR